MGIVNDIIRLTWIQVHGGPEERVKHLPQLRDAMKTPGLAETLVSCVTQIIRALIGWDKAKAERFEDYLKTHEEK